MELHKNTSHANFHIGLLPFATQGLTVYKNKMIKAAKFFLTAFHP